MPDLVKQPTAAPTRKMEAVGISGAITVALVAGINYLWPGVGDSYAIVIGAAVTWAVTSASGYITKERA